MYSLNHDAKGNLMICMIMVFKDYRLCLSWYYKNHVLTKLKAPFLYNICSEYWSMLYMILHSSVEPFNYWATFFS